MYQLEITESELKLGIDQLTIRINEFRNIVAQENRKGNVKRAFELEEYIKPIMSLRDKMLSSYKK